jgi:hypothetical protein
VAGSPGEGIGDGRRRKQNQRNEILTPQEAYIRSALALATARLFPPLVRDAVFADDLFAESVALTRYATITFHPSGVSFSRSDLFNAIREASKSATASMDVSDEVGRKWTLKFERDQAPLTLSIMSESQRFLAAAHLLGLSDITDDRIKMLNMEASRVNLPETDRERWQSIISHRPLNDNEIAAFASDINNTPVAVSHAISGTLNSDSIPLATLVPRAAQYYERLVGRFADQPSIKEYADEVLIEHMRQLVRWRDDEGMKQCLLLCSHPLPIVALASADIPTEVFIRILNWAIEDGDAIARCAAIEVALLRAEAHPKIIELLAEVSAAVATEHGDQDKQFEVLSATFVFVYGQLAHTKCLASRPTYWRRLAALAHAALITRCMVPKRGDLSELAENMKRIRIRPFVLQVYVDLRLGPLWQSQWIMSNQLRNELVGRVLARAASSLEAARALGLEDRLLGDGSDSLKSKVNLFLTQMPGPLEDNIVLREISVDDHAIIAAGLSDAKPNAASFAPLVNSAFLYRLPIELSEMAAAALQRSQFRIDAQGDRAAFSACLVGLASVAAVSRCPALADAVFTVIRYYRQVSPAELGLAEAMHAGTIACASHSKMAEWAGALGSLMAEFAFRGSSKDEAVALRENILDFCDLVPELWASLGPALAASEAAAA